MSIAKISCDPLLLPMPSGHAFQGAGARGSTTPVTENTPLGKDELPLLA